MSIIESNLCCMILSGGEASRAGGVNKSFLQVDEMEILEHQLERLEILIPRERIVVVTDRPEDYLMSGLRCVEDLEFESLSRSAMRGFYSALAQAPREWVFVLANDMPWPNERLIELMCERVASEKLKGACLKRGEQLEPMHAIYHRSLAEELRERMMTGDSKQLSLQAWLGNHTRIARLEPEECGLTQRELEECTANFNTDPRQD